MQNKIYIHPRCTTCLKALAFLKKNEITFQQFDILQIPPTHLELKEALKHESNLKKILNTSGRIYREMPEREAFLSSDPESIIDELVKNPMLIKRPFLIAQKGTLVGFDEKKWKDFFSR